MKQRILNYLIRQWAKIAGIEPDYTIEIIRRQCLMIRECAKCSTYLECTILQRQAEFYLGAVCFGDNQLAVNALGVVNSHIGWRIREIEEQAKKQQHDQQP